MSPALVEAHGLVKHFPLGRSLADVISRKPGEVIHAVDGVSLEINDGETLGLIGESGSGKTTLGWLLAKLHVPTAGRIRFAGQDITDVTGPPCMATERPSGVSRPGWFLGSTAARLADRGRTDPGPGASQSRGAQESCRRNPPDGRPARGFSRSVSARVLRGRAAASVIGSGVERPPEVADP